MVGLLLSLEPSCTVSILHSAMETELLDGICAVAWAVLLLFATETTECPDAVGGPSSLPAAAGSDKDN